MKDKEKRNISMKEMLTKRSFEPITNCNCEIESRIDYAVRNENGEGTPADLLNQEIEELQRAKSIEEMGKEIEKAKQHIWASVRTQAEDEDYLWHSRAIAEHLMSQGYQKVPEGSVVLSKEEYESLKADNNKYVKDCIDYIATISKLENRVWEVEQQASKETAERFLQLAYDRCLEKSFIKKVEELAKQFGVEIKG